MDHKENTKHQAPKPWRSYLQIFVLIVGLFSITLTATAIASQNLSLFSRAASNIQSFALRIGDKGVVQCLEGKLSVSWTNANSRKSMNIACVKDGKTPVPTALPTVMPTTMPSSMPMPSGSPAPNGSSSTGSGFGVGKDGGAVGINLAVFNQVKADATKGIYDRPCTAAEHDKTQWHSLVNVEKKCHYDHEHGDDPNYVNDVFGQPGAWFNKSGQSVSYPWQTFTLPTTTTDVQALTMSGTEGQKENDLKHPGYYWVVRRNQTCDEGKWCITDSRLQFHFMSSHHNEVGSRFHSFSFEGRLCKDPKDPSTCGIYKTGGQTDHGQLIVAELGESCWGALNDLRDPEKKASVKAQIITLPSDTQYFPLDFDGLVDELRCHKRISSTTLAAFPNGLTSEPPAEWWTHGGSDFRYVVSVFDPISNVDVSNPSGVTTANGPYCKQGDVTCRWNNSRISAGEGYTTQIYKDYAGLDADSNNDGRTDLSQGKAYQDRFGNMNFKCSAPGLDCVPLILTGVPLSEPDKSNQRYSNRQCDTCTLIDHDLTPSGRADWIDWFHKM